MATRQHLLFSDKFTINQNLFAPGKAITYTGEFSLQSDVDLWEACGKYARYVLTPEKAGLVITLPLMDTIQSHDGTAVAAGHDIIFVNRSKHTINIVNHLGSSIEVLEGDKNCKIVASDKEAKKWFVESKTSALDPNDIVKPSFQQVYTFSNGDEPSIQLTEELGGISIMDTDTGLASVFNVTTAGNFTLINAGNTADGQNKPALSMLGGSATGDKSFALGEGALASGDSTLVLSAGIEVAESGDGSLTMAAANKFVQTFGSVPEGKNFSSPHSTLKAHTFASVVPYQLTEIKLMDLAPGTTYLFDIGITGKDNIAKSNGLFTVDLKGTISMCSDIDGKSYLVQNFRSGEYAYPPKIDKHEVRHALRLEGQTLVLGLACADSVAEGEKGSCRADLIMRYSSTTVV